MTALLLLLALGPAQTISGKYYRHSPEYLKRYPAEGPFDLAEIPADVDRICAAIEAGGGPAKHLFMALGEALLARGDRELAYRAFDKAQRMQAAEDAEAKPTGPPLDARHVVERKDACKVYVLEKTIRAEEREAQVWVDALQSFERDAIHRGRDPRDLQAFFERYGRPEDDLNRLIRARQISFLGGILGVFLGVAFAFAAPRLRKRAAAIPLIVAMGCFAAPLGLGLTGLLLWGGAFALCGGLIVSWRGR